MNKQMSILLKRDEEEEDETKEEDSEKTIKIVIVGDGTCKSLTRSKCSVRFIPGGKTSLCTRFAQRDFTGRYTQVNQPTTPYI